jgi:hypothetical protein
VPLILDSALSLLYWSNFAKTGVDKANVPQERLPFREYFSENWMLTQIGSKGTNVTLTIFQLEIDALRYSSLKKPHILIFNHFSLRSSVEVDLQQ